MRRPGALVVLLGSLAGCELLVGITDKTAITDAGSEAGGDEAGTDPDLPCASQSGFLFCDDFDTELEAGDTWGWDQPRNGGSIEMDTTDHVSAPRSAQIIAAAAQNAQAQLGRDVGSLATGFRLAFDLRIDTDLASLSQVGVAQTNSTTSNLTLNYVLGPGKGAELQAYGPNQTLLAGIALPTPPRQQWTRIVLVYDAAQGLTVIEDGAVLASNTALAKGAPGDTSIILGAVFVNPSTGAAPYQVEIDNVVMRGQ